MSRPFVRMLAGIGLFVAVTEGEIHRALGARRMTRGIEKLGDHTILCGFGRMGRILARQLEEARMMFVVVDANEERIREAEDAGFLTLCGDATHEDVLSRAGVEVGGNHGFLIVAIRQESGKVVVNPAAETPSPRAAS